MEVIGLMTLTAVVVGALITAIKGGHPLNPPAPPRPQPPAAEGFRPLPPPARSATPRPAAGAGLRKTTGASEPTVDWATGRRR